MIYVTWRMAVPLLGFIFLLTGKILIFSRNCDYSYWKSRFHWAVRTLIPCRILGFTSKRENTAEVGGQPIFDLEDPMQLATFLKGETRTLAVPGRTRLVQYDASPRSGVCLSRMGTSEAYSEAVALGAYAFALKQLSVKLSY